MQSGSDISANSRLTAMKKKNLNFIKFIYEDFSKTIVKLNRGHTYIKIATLICAPIGI